MLSSSLDRARKLFSSSILNGTGVSRERNASPADRYLVTAIAGIDDLSQQEVLMNIVIT